MQTTIKTVFDRQVSALIQQVEVFSQVVKLQPGVVPCERDELLEMLLQPAKNLQFVRRKLDKMNR